MKYGYSIVPPSPYSDTTTYIACYSCTHWADSCQNTDKTTKITYIAKLVTFFPTWTSQIFSSNLIPYAGHVQNIANRQLNETKYDSASVEMLHVSGIQFNARTLALYIVTYDAKSSI